MKMSDLGVRFINGDTAKLADELTDAAIDAGATHALSEYRESVAVIIDAVMTLGPLCSDQEAVNLWAQRRLNLAADVLVDAVTDSSPV